MDEDRHRWNETFEGEMPPGLVAAGDQYRAEAVDMVRNSRQVMVFVEPTSENTKFHSALIQEGNLVGIVNFLYASHIRFHEILDDAVDELHPAAKMYFLSLVRGAAMIDPETGEPFDEEG